MLNLISLLIDYAANVDFSALSANSLFFSGASGVECLSVSILDDSVVEVNETFSVLLAASSSAVDVAPSLATVTIIDDDRVTIGWSSLAYELDENGPSTATICAEIIEGEIARQITAVYSTMDDTTQGTMLLILAYNHDKIDI